jgi:hypothetical protein
VLATAHTAVDTAIFSYKSITYWNRKRAFHSFHGWPLFRRNLSGFLSPKEEKRERKKVKVKNKGEAAKFSS